MALKLKDKKETKDKNKFTDIYKSSDFNFIKNKIIEFLTKDKKIFSFIRKYIACIFIGCVLNLIVLMIGNSVLVTFKIDSKINVLENIVPTNFFTLELSFLSSLLAFIIVLIIQKIVHSIRVCLKTKVASLIDVKSREYVIYEIIKKDNRFFLENEKGIISEEIYVFIDLFQDVVLEFIDLCESLFVCLLYFAFSTGSIMTMILNSPNLLILWQKIIVIFIISILFGILYNFYFHFFKTYNMFQKQINIVTNKFSTLLFDELVNINDIQAFASQNSEKKFMNEILINLRSNYKEELNSKINMHFILLLFYVSFSLFTGILFYMALFDEKQKILMEIDNNLQINNNLNLFSISEFKSIYKIFNDLNNTQNGDIDIQGKKIRHSDLVKKIGQLLISFKSTIFDTSTHFFEKFYECSFHYEKNSENCFELIHALNTLNLNKIDNNVSLCSSDKCKFYLSDEEISELKKEKLILQDINIVIQDKHIIKNINLELISGVNYGFIGPSGSGKTTLIKAILGQIEYDGQISLGQYFQKRMNSCCWVKLISYIPQNGNLLDRSIYENMINDYEKKNDYKLYEKIIEESLEKSALSLFVDSLPEKIFTKVGFSGELLSGGQRQRVCISRAFTKLALEKSACIIIEDECTSALDTGCEKIIIQSLADEVKNKNLFLISICHRQSRMLGLDKFFLFSHGSIVKILNLEEALSLQSNSQEDE